MLDDICPLSQAAEEPCSLLGAAERSGVELAYITESSGVVVHRGSYHRVILEVVDAMRDAWLKKTE